jgi:mannose/fructose/N-acetylgalactosamine-specific phosphotransferase system component IIB
MPITMFRIDDRYIHGQVATQWMRAMPVRKIFVINDWVVKDNMTTMVLEMAASTQSIDLEILGVDDGVKRLIEVADNDERMWALFGNPQDVATALRTGVKMDKIIVGFMRHSGTKKAVMQGGQVYVDEADITSLREIQDAGVEIVVQRVPDERPVDVMKLIEKLK